MSANEEVRKLVFELRLLEGTSESLQSRLAFLNAALAELNVAQKTLDEITKEDLESELFVPVGGGSYIKARLSDISKVVYGVGAGVAIEKTPEEAAENMSKRISDLSNTKQSYERQLSQILRKIQEDQTRLQKLSKDFRG